MGPFMQINTRSNLVEVDADRKVAYFQNLEKPDEEPTAVEVLVKKIPMNDDDCCF